MCLLFETIRVFEKKLCNLKYHNLRFNRSCRDIFGIENIPDLSEVIAIPDNIGAGTYKCKLIYDEKIQSLGFEPYIRKDIKSLRLVHNNSIDYNYKYLNRNEISAMLDSENADKEIIIVKNGFVTDTSFSNIAFYNGINWLTPSKPLLEGTMRSSLLDKNLITSAQIRVEDIFSFEKISLINAMNCLGDIEFPVSLIRN